MNLWQSNLPAAWSLKPLRSVAAYNVSNVDKVSAEGETPVRLCNYTDVYNHEFITASMSFMRSTADREEIRRFGLLVDDVMITKDSESWEDIAIPALVIETAPDLVCGYHLAVLRPKADVLIGRFLLRCLQAKPVRIALELSANGVTRFGIPKADIGGLALPIPPLDLQCVIADYLDRETARIDALVAAKERVLALLAEKRRALITGAVTRGIDSNARLRDSGIAWLGEIPHHWRTIALRFLVSVSGGATPDTNNGALWDGDIPWVSPKDMKRDVISDAADHLSDLALANTALKLIARDAVLVVVRGMILVHSLPVAVNDRPVTINQDMKALRCSRSLEPLFLRDYFKGFEQHLVSLTDSSAHGTRKLDSESLGRFEIAAPPLDEQRAIIEHIATETAKLDSLAAATERTIALLKERRAALISAAVTGQIDVTPRDSHGISGHH